MKMQGTDKVAFALISFVFYLQYLEKCFAQTVEDENVEEQSVVADEDRGIEEEILGPLRVWHIIFLSFSAVITIIVVICCFHTFRIPRTRKEIEENYKKRIVNSQYLRLLERSPDRAVKTKTGDVSVTETSGKPKPVKPTRVKVSHVSGREPSSVREEDESASPYKPMAKVKVATPLALSAKDILAQMAKQKANRTDS